MVRTGTVAEVGSPRMGMGVEGGFRGLSKQEWERMRCRVLIWENGVGGVGLLQGGGGKYVYA